MTPMAARQETWRSLQTSRTLAWSLQGSHGGKKDEIQGAAGRIQGDEICESTGKLPLRESNIEPARKPFFNRKVVFQPSIFRCYVSFRELLEVLVVQIGWKIPHLLPGWFLIQLAGMGIQWKGAFDPGSVSWRLPGVVIHATSDTFPR